MAFERAVYFSSRTMKARWSVYASSERSVKKCELCRIGMKDGRTLDIIVEDGRFKMDGTGKAADPFFWLCLWLHIACLGLVR